MLKFWLETLSQAALFTALALGGDELLARSGLARSDRILTAAGGFTVALILRLAYPNFSWWIAWPVLLLLVEMSLHRLDLMQTISKGRWWWRQDQ